VNASASPTMVKVSPVEGKRELEEFIAFPYDLHRKDPVWIGPLRMDVRTILSPAKNPFWEHAAAQHFLARSNGTVVGRISAIDNKAHNEMHKDKVGFFGFFESIDDPAVANALFEAAAAWLRGRGFEVMRGPVSPSMNDEIGLLIDGYEYPPVVMMPHNPRYYPKLVEGAGFAKAKDLVAFQNVQKDYPERLQRGVALLEKRYGFTVRTLDMKNFDRDLEIVKKIYNKAWEHNWGHVPMTDHEIEHLAHQFKPVIVPEMVVFAEHKGEVVGMAVAVPDFNVAFKKSRNGKLFPGILRVLWTIKFGDIGRARVLILGTIPEWRGKGVDALMYKRIWENGNARGYMWCEGGWVLEDNAAMKNGLEGIGFAVYKTYRLYDRPLS
jgi:GNAT superfamily N-acetyltransferase